MDKQTYINNLKKTDLRPDKIKIKERKEEILIEKTIPDEKKILQELFVQLGEISAMSKGVRKDMAILRLSIVAEYDAASLYEQMSTQVSSNKIKKVLLEIANEEKTHIGEFKTLLENIDIDHVNRTDEGKKEVKKIETGDEAPTE